MIRPNLGQIDLLTELISQVCMGSALEWVKGSIKLSFKDKSCSHVFFKDFFAVIY